jgi:hypothetical protein
MSFGTSVGDIVALIQLAHRSYRNCKRAGGEYLEIAREVRSLHSVLRSLREESEKPDSSLFEDDTASEFSSISDGCKGVLEGIEQLLAKYNGLAEDGVETSQPKKIWHRMRFGAEVEDLGKFRWKIITYTSSLAVFLDSLHLKSSDRVEKATGRVENKLEAGFAEVMDRLDRLEGFGPMSKGVFYIATKARASERYTSVSSIGSVLSLSTYADDDPEVWRQFRRELIALGFKSDSLDRHKEVLKAYMTRLDQTGVLDNAVVQAGKSHQPWCNNSFFRLTTTELPHIEEEDEVLFIEKVLDWDAPILPPTQTDDTASVTPGPDSSISLPDTGNNVEQSSKMSGPTSPSRRRRVPRPRGESINEHPNSPGRGAVPMELQPAPQNGFMPTGGGGGGGGGDEPPAPTGDCFSQRKSVNPTPPPPREPPSTGNPIPKNLRRHRDSAVPQIEERKSTPYSTHGGEKLNPFENADIKRSKITLERSEGFGNNQVPRADSDSNLATESRDSRPFQRQTEARPACWSDFDTDSISSDDTVGPGGRQRSSVSLNSKERSENKRIRVPTAAPSAGAERYKINFQPPYPSAWQSAQEGPEARESTYKAWENLRHANKADPGPGKTWSAGGDGERASHTSK